MKNKKLGVLMLACSLAVSSMGGAVVFGEEGEVTISDTPDGDDVSDELNGDVGEYEDPEEPVPSTEAPSTEAPSTEAPSTEAPSTEAPWTEEPVPEPMPEPVPEPVPEPMPSTDAPSYDPGYNYDYDDYVPEEPEYYEGDEENRAVDVSGNLNAQSTHEVGDFDIPGVEEARKDFNLPATSDLPRQIYLKVPEIFQNPELPTGCEVTALSMALQFDGFNVDKVTLADEFLIYNRETDNLALGFVGDPHSEDGAGCFAPAIAATAQAFFEENQASYKVYDISGSSMDELCAYIALGRPVMIWTTMYMEEPEFTEDETEYNGRTYQWYRQEHCVVLSGYNMEERTLQINDPLDGIVERSMDEFAAIYEKTGKNAIVFRKTEGEKVSVQATAELPALDSATEVGVN